MVDSYRDLIAWQKAMDLVTEVYRVTASMPEAERFGLTSQLRRAAVSVPSMLAEGHARGSTREFVRYVAMAMGSLAEIETQLLICMRLEFANQTSLQKLLAQCDEQNRILRGLTKSLSHKLEQSRSPLAPRPSPL
ncbi:MAG TPA: four helix bundle protein [Rudaea sp.]|jgi:four helix bundle protein|nr:four helix bundle protein [Rudaea sp.]